MALARAPPIELEDGEKQPRVEVAKEADAGMLGVGVEVEEEAAAALKPHRVDWGSTTGCV